MDSLTQAALGASIGEVVLGCRIGKRAPILGAIVATIPDLDVVMLPFMDPLQKISIHRGYSHSLLFCVLGTFLLALIMSRINWTRGLSLIRLLCFTFLTLTTHVMLDVFTPYGTQLYLPWSDERVSFDSIGVVDPAYSLPLLVGIVLSVIYYKKSERKARLANVIGLTVSTLYLLFTLVNKTRVENVFSNQANDSGIEMVDLLTVPVSAGNFIWYGVLKDHTHLHIGRYSPFDDAQIKFEAFPINDQLLTDLDPQLVDRMRWFSKDFYCVAENDGVIRLYNMQCDMQGIRYFDDYKAPTAFYFEIVDDGKGSYLLESRKHEESIDNDR
jgi:inner membrane protein